MANSGVDESAVAGDKASNLWCDVYVEVLTLSARRLVDTPIAVI